VKISPYFLVAGNPLEHTGSRKLLSIFGKTMEDKKIAFAYEENAVVYKIEIINFINLLSPGLL
jgi:hypothetical protein